MGQRVPRHAHSIIFYNDYCCVDAMKMYYCRVRVCISNKSTGTIYSSLINYVELMSKVIMLIMMILRHSYYFW